jgi:hypothetical protein
MRSPLNSGVSFEAAVVEKLGRLHRKIRYGESRFRPAIHKTVDSLSAANKG